MKPVNQTRTGYLCFSFLWLAILACISVGLSGCSSTPEWVIESQTTAKKMETEPVVFREGDIVKIVSRDAPTLNTIAQVRRDGKISLTMVNEIVAVGKTPRELQDELIKRYEPFIDVHEILVTLESIGFPVYVTGAVLQPHKVISDHPLTVLDAIMEAGGPNYSTANLKAVKVLRNVNGKMENHIINIKNVIMGKSGETFYCKPKDIIYVPEKFSWL
jgi:polysaccharide export outer membrane protein